MFPCRQVSISIDRPPADNYEFASNPANLPRWARGIGDSIDNVNGEWVAASPIGSVKVRFADRNPYGVLDHAVTLPSGETIDNPMRVVPNDTGCELTFTLFRRPGMTDAAFEADAAAVAADFATLKALLDAHED